MLPPGNDIIDLSAGSGHRPEYYDRLRRLSCDDSEREMVTFLPEVDGLWLLWSIKEAAFKSAVKMGWDIRFRGKDFPVRQLTNIDLVHSVVAVEDYLIPVISEVDERYIHSWTVVDRNQSLAGVVEMEEESYEVQSRQARTAAINELARRRGISTEELAIHKDSREVPYFRHLEKRMNVDLSLSHHGRFGAFLITL